MSPETHSQLAGFIWSICNLLRGPYRPNEYRKVILPMTVLRRFDCVLEPTREAVWAEEKALQGKSDNIRDTRLKQVAGGSKQFYNLSKLTFPKLLDDTDQIAANLNGYINGFSENVRRIMERFDFGVQIAKMQDKNLLYEVVKKFANIDLSPDRVDNIQMGYIFEELIRIGSEQANEEAGDHFTPREVIRLMVNLLLDPEQDLTKSQIVKMIYDPACGTGGMLSESEEYIRQLNSEARPLLFGQDYNDESWAVCRSDMLIKGNEADNIILGDSFTEDGFPNQKYDYMLANPPFGVEWKQQQKTIEDEHSKLGYDGRFGAGTPRINDGSLLFLQHMLSKMRTVKKGGSRIGIIFNGSPLFTGDAGSGESEIRRWIIENDWLEAIVALPDQLFYNTGISTYLWILTNRKEEERRGKVQLIDARQYFAKMRKSLGNKRHYITDEQIDEITRIYGSFQHDETRVFTIDGVEKERSVSKIFDNDDFGYRKITVERPLRLNFQASDERIARIEDQKTFQNLAVSKKKNETVKREEEELGRQRQQHIRNLLKRVQEITGGRLFNDRDEFFKHLKAVDKSMHGARLSAPELKAVLAALSEQDEDAVICTDAKGNPESDSDLRDTEIVPLKDDVEAYFEREVNPHVPDAWIDHSKTKVGYEIPLNRHFYVYEPPRPLDEISADLKALESDILSLLHDVTNGGETNS